MYSACFIEFLIPWNFELVSFFAVSALNKPENRLFKTEYLNLTLELELSNLKNFKSSLQSYPYVGNPVFVYLLQVY